MCPPPPPLRYARAAYLPYSMERNRPLVIKKRVIFAYLIANDSTVYDFRTPSVYTAVISKKREEEREWEKERGKSCKLEPTAEVSASLPSRKNKILPSAIKDSPKMTRLPDCLIASCLSRAKKRSDVRATMHTRLTWIITTYFRALKYLSRIHRFTFSFLLFCTCTHLLVHGAAAARRAAYFLCTEEKYIRRGAYATFSVDLYAIFFLKPHTNLHDGCITRIWVPFYRASSGTRFSALL